MKALGTQKYRFILTLALASLPLLTSCGSSERPADPTPAPPGVQNPVPNPGGGPVAPVNPINPVTQRPCLPINAPIPFIGSNVYVDSANIFAGRNPTGTSPTVGTVEIGGPGGPGNFQNDPRLQTDGVISMNIVPISQPNQTLPSQSYMPGQAGCLPGGPCPYVGNFQPPSQFGQDKTANISGTLQISTAAQQDLLYQIQSGAIQVPNAGSPSSVCVSGIGINMGHNNLVLYGGFVYLYLNNSEHGYILYF